MVACLVHLLLRSSDAGCTVLFAQSTTVVTAQAGHSLAEYFQYPICIGLSMGGKSRP